MTKKIYTESFKKGLLPDPDLTVSEWSDAYRVLPKKSSAEAGKWRTIRTPYLKEIMDVSSTYDYTEQVVIMKGTQLGLTEALQNIAFYYMDQVPSSILMIMPTERLATQHSKRKLKPSIEEIIKLKEKIKNGKSKNDIGSQFTMEYPGGVFSLGWSNSTANFRSFSCRVILLDDVDGFPTDVEGEGSAIELAKKRADAFANRKIIINSTPTISGASNIEKEYEVSDQRKYYMPCPDCNNMINFEWENFILEHTDDYKLINDVEYKCPNCGSLIKEYQKTKMMEKGEWIPTKESDIKGYLLPSFYSPIGWLSWKKIAEEFLKAYALSKKGDMKLLKTWKNTRLALPYEEDLYTVDISNIETRAEEYETEVPEGVFVLTAGIDTQDNRFEVEVVGWGKDGESWGIEYKVIHGDPKDPLTQKYLDDFLSKEYNCIDGEKMKVLSVAIDSGGHRTQSVYEYCKNRYSKRRYPIKGIGDTTGTFVNQRTTKTAKNVPLHTIRVNVAKDEIMANIQIQEYGPNYMHFPKGMGYDTEYFNQWGAEKRNAKGQWVRYKLRSEAIDCRIYAWASLVIMGLNVDKLHNPLSENIKKKNTETSTKKIKQINKSRSGFINSWKKF